MIVVGLTGGIASGKSTVAAIFREQGIPVIDADHLAKEAVKPGQPALQKIAKRFGKGIFAPDSSLDRQKMADIVFSDPTARADLEAIIHPLVEKMFREQLDQWESRGASIVVYDVPLLFEGGLEKNVDYTIVVYLEEEKRVERLMARNRLSEQEARQRLLAQMSLAEKRDRADFVINNVGSLSETRDQVMHVLHALREKSR